MNINDADFQNAVYETVYNMTSLIWLIYNTYGSESIGSFHFEIIISSLAQLSLIYKNDFVLLETFKN